MSSPSDEELLGYLYDKVNGKPLPNTVSIYECRLYAENPWTIWANHGGADLERSGSVYLLTELKKHRKKISRELESPRAVWSQEHLVKEIPTQYGVGFKRRFRYENPKDPNFPEHGRWIMLEYSFKYDGQRIFAICELRRNTNTTRGRKKRTTTGPQIESSKQETESLQGHSSSSTQGSEIELLDNKDRSTWMGWERLP